MSDVELEKRARLEAERRERAAKEKKPTLLEDLAFAGALGWRVVVPALAGLLAGRWLDAVSGRGVVFTAALLAAGVALGSMLAWKRVVKP